LSLSGSGWNRYSSLVRAALVIACLLSLREISRAESYDLVIRHGRVVDGTGNPAFFADVAVKYGRIAAMGQIKAQASTEIDATGMIIAPGFIDVHTHADDVADAPEAQNFLRMGVTTIIVGNCGGSNLDVGQFFREIEQKAVCFWWGWA
jgi:N-acyl-D-amino-acid deacylase